MPAALPPPQRILILCTGNSARSQIAEALLQTRGGARFHVESAGSRPAGRVNPLAIEVLSEAGVDWQGRTPRGLEAVENRSWDFVITVCDRAHEACPIFPGTTIRAHWGMPDPAEVEGTDEEKRRAFRQALLELSRRIDLFLAIPFGKIEREALERRVREIGNA